MPNSPPGNAPAPVDAPHAETRHAWTFAAGIGSNGIIGGLGAPALAIGGLITVERHLAGPLWAMARGNVSYAHDDWSGPTAYGGSLEGNAASVGGWIGLKLSFGSLEVLQVSPYLAFGGSYSWVQGTSVAGKARSIGGNLGVAFDHDLVRGFGVRLSADVLDLTHSWMTETNPDLPVGGAQSSATSFTLSFQPSVELRWSF